MKLHFTGEDFDAADYVGEVRRKPLPVVKVTIPPELEGRMAKAMADAMKTGVGVYHITEEDLDRTVIGLPLLREPISTQNPLPSGCFCKPGRCSAPVIMGRQTPCRDPQKAMKVKK